MSSSLHLAVMCMHTYIRMYSHKQDDYTYIVAYVCTYVYASKLDYTRLRVSNYSCTYATRLHSSTLYCKISQMRTSRITCHLDLLCRVLARLWLGYMPYTGSWL